MNERIKELSEQALEIVSKKRLLKDGQLERTWNPDDYDQVFAELIIQDVMNLFGDEILSLHYLEQECCQDSVHLLKSKIKQHFGVEE